MGKGAQGESNGLIVKSKLEEFTWDVIKEKTTRDEKWLVIDGEVYNITNWSRKHPGGPKVITHYAGQDATDAFKAFHNDLNFIKKYMKAIHIGTLKDSQRVVSPIEQDFRELRETAEKMGLFKPSTLFFCLHMFHILFLDWAAWATMYYFGTGWIPYLASLLMITTVEAQTGWIQHSTLATCLCSNTLNGIIFCTIFLSGIIKGASPSWWNHMHYQHHAKPNVMDKDPDVRVGSFVCGRVTRCQWR
ncbi:Acyl-CoA 6-desaturase [Bulinus truncatus]|nr:Acyl-CoA 6-desaturase [Bulinus truncatus]